MNLINCEVLFGMQKILNEKIVKEKCLEGRSLIREKVLALMLELGELGNELPEEFKYWSNKKNDRARALVEYVDGLHLLLSIGLEIKKVDEKPVETLPYIAYVGPFNKKPVDELRSLIAYADKLDAHEEEVMDYFIYFCMFLGFGKTLGFSWDEIKKAYIEKNKINIERQDSGY